MKVCFQLLNICVTWSLNLVRQLFSSWSRFFGSYRHMNSGVGYLWMPERLFTDISWGPGVSPSISTTPTPWLRAFLGEATLIELVPLGPRSHKSFAFLPHCVW